MRDEVRAALDRLKRGNWDGVVVDPAGWPENLADGEIVFTESNAPDRGDYRKCQAGYTAYLRDCYKWAGAEFRFAVEEHRKIMADIEAAPIPPLVDTSDRALGRETVDDTLHEAEMSFLLVGLYRDRLSKIALAYRSR